MDKPDDVDLKERNILGESALYISSFMDIEALLELFF